MTTKTELPTFGDRVLAALERSWAETDKRKKAARRTQPEEAAADLDAFGGPNA
jgi:hypothetical protein